MTIRSTIPSPEEILTVFDQLVQEGIIIYGPYRTIKHDAGGYPLEFRICPAFARKPHTVGAKLDSGFDATKLTQWGPGSDLFCPDDRMKIAQLNGTHDLAFNMFCADRPQFLLLTLDSWKRQDEPLETADLEAALMLMRAVEGVYVIFNGGRDAGCSRVHKHLQGLKGPPPAYECFVDPMKRPCVPFKFFSHRFVEGFGNVTGAQVKAVYDQLLSQAKAVLGLEQSEVACPHGMFLWGDCMVVIPRRTASVEGTRASAATGGMIGSVWLHEEAPVEDWVRLGCRNVLTQLGVPP